MRRESKSPRILRILYRVLEFVYPDPHRDPRDGAREASVNTVLELASVIPNRESQNRVSRLRDAPGVRGIFHNGSLASWSAVGAGAHDEHPEEQVSKAQYGREAVFYYR